MHSKPEKAALAFGAAVHAGARSGCRIRQFCKVYTESRGIFGDVKKRGTGIRLSKAIDHQTFRMLKSVKDLPIRS